MKPELWKRFKRAALGETDDGKGVVPALIVDSPWIPGFTGTATMDYFSLPDAWVRANLAIEERFPDVVFLPHYWMEYGMATEPSGFGCGVKWWKNSPPAVIHAMRDISDVGKMKVPNPREDGLMPLLLNLCPYIEKAARAKGSLVKMVAARGPLAIGAHVRGTTELMIDLKINPSETKNLIEMTTQTTIRWLQAQIEAFSEIEGILVLDDIVGFLSPPDYMEFAHPYMKEIFSAFKNMVKVYHNDSKIDHIMEPLAETGLHVLNFGYSDDMDVAWKKVGKKIRLMGNIPTLEVLMDGTPDEVKAHGRECIRKTAGGKGLILSAGGACPPGVKAENIDALVETAKEG